MKVLYAASEARPFIASGGLADVAGSLPRALLDQDVDCRVIMPLYEDTPHELRQQLTPVASFNVSLGWRNQYCGLLECEMGGVTYYFLDNKYYFWRKGIYGFYDDAERFAFFSKGICEALFHLDFSPDVIHCNDWQSALVPVYLNSYYRSSEKHRYIRTIFTIHNIQYQGKYGMELLDDVLGLPGYAARWVEYDGALNMMKGAIEQSDRISTVSPTYAEEILDPWFSHGLDHILVERRDKLSGILNGIDVESYNPETDPTLVKHFSAKAPEGKVENKAELQKLLGLAQEPDTMLISIVSRLVSHKGIDLVSRIFDELMTRNVQLAILGSGEPIYENFFTEMSQRYPGRVAVEIGFLPQLSRKMYAGSDAFLMPSKSEPCGLAQMISLRYGTIPIVRTTGGLRDSITDLDDADGNGYTFQTYNAHDMLAAIDRCLALYGQKKEWNAAVHHAMECDFSWKSSAAKYVELYQDVLGKA